MYEPPGPTVGHLQLSKKMTNARQMHPPLHRGGEDADVRLEL